MSSELLSGLIGSIIGGLIAAFAAGIAVYLQIDEERQKGKRQRRQETIDTLVAMKAELLAVEARYLSTAGEGLKNLADGDGFLGYYPVFADYFAVFHSSLSTIGRIGDRALIERIVLSYTKLKGFADSFRLNNILVEKLENVTFLLQQNPESVPLQQNHRARQLILADYAAKLKQADLQFREEMPELIDDIDAAIKSMTDQ